jgi:hypothetical protein
MKGEVMPGFDNRVFLTDPEWKTYLKRAPVRYVKHQKASCCVVCGGSSKKLQNAHLIPFLKGVKKYKLTPDFLDRRENIVTACIGSCNKSCEWSDSQIESFLKGLKRKDPSETYFN